mgnify:CR=1 FL=1
MRIGIGYDVHAFAEGRPLVMGGVPIQHSKGLVGHSDADVLIHAVMDALLGAAGLGDIGRHFPDTDERYCGADSVELLAGYRTGNIDAVVIAQSPRLASYLPQMEARIAQALDIPVSAVNVKATTTEHLGFEGREEGIAAQAVCTINPLS